MSTELDVAKMMWGWGASGGSGSSRPGSSYGTQTVTRYGTVQSVNDDGTVTILLDSGETVTLKTDTPLRVGDRVVVVAQGGTYLVYSMAGTVGIIENTRTELAQEIIDEGQAIRDEVDQEMNDFKADHQLTDADITSSIEQTKSEITATFEGQISDLEGDISQEYATKTEVSTGIDGLRTEVSETYATSEGVTNEINSAITQASGEISSEVEQNVMNSVGETYATKTELTQTADSLELTIDSSLSSGYATCTTIGSARVKYAYTTNRSFTLDTGKSVSVKFTDANTASNPTLDVDGTGAKPIYLQGSAITPENSWDYDDTVTFVYDGTRWNVADPSLKDAKTVASYFIANAAGLTVGQEGQDSAVRMSSGGSFDVLSNDEEIFSIASVYNGTASGYVTSLSADAWDGIVIETAGSSRLEITRGGYFFSSMEGGFEVNDMRSVETFEYTPTSPYGSFTVNLSPSHMSGYNLQFVCIYWHIPYSGDRNSSKLHIARGQTKYIDLKDVRNWPGSSPENMTICVEQVAVIVDSSGRSVQINRGQTGRSSISANNVNNYNSNPGQLFCIDRVTVCS